MTRIDEDYDVIVVGASLAGCTAATLLGRHGLRVLLLERASDPAAYKKICTHFLQPGANATLRRLGLEEALVRAGAQRNAYESWTPFGWLSWPEGAEAGYNIRREVLDPMLRKRAAETPGVTLLLGHSARDVIVERDNAGERIAGVRVETKDGGAQRVRAKLVVAADGRHGKLGDLAGVPATETAHGRFLYFAYYQGLELDSGGRSMAWVGDPNAAYCFRNDDQQTLVCVVPTKAKLPEFRKNLEQAFVTMVEALPHAPKLATARRVSDILGMIEMPNHTRPVSARGMAFIGDAALTSDPLFGVGCGWALQSAEWLADAVAPALLAARADASTRSSAHDTSLAAGLAQYSAKHHAELSQHHKLIADLSPGRRFNALERGLFRGAIRDEALALGLQRMISRLAQPSAFLTLKTLLRVAWVNLTKKAPRATGPRATGVVTSATRVASISQVSEPAGVFKG
jgi:flavin-dependent dehydrogenase